MFEEAEGVFAIDVGDIVSGISDLIRGRSEQDRLAVLERICRAVIEEAAMPPQNTPTIESLHVWDLLSKSTYMALQFALNDDPQAGAIVWEDRKIGLIEPMFERSERLFSRWAPFKVAELAFALERVACRSPRVAIWWDSALGHSYIESVQRHDLLAAYQRRKAQNDSKLLMWQLRKDEGLSVGDIAQRYRLSPYTVRSFIKQANDLDARRRFVADPDITRQHQSECF